MYMTRSTAAPVSGLFSKVCLLLTPGLALTALGAYAGQGITNGWHILVLALLFLGGSFAARAIARWNKFYGFITLMVWTFITGLFLGRGNTVFLAFPWVVGITAGCGAIGALSGRDFSNWGNWLLFALLGLIVAGIVNIFVSFGSVGTMIFSGIGMVVFAGFFIFDFFRLSRSENTWDSAFDLTINLFLDYLNFLLYLLRFLEAFLGSSDD